MQRDEYGARARERLRGQESIGVSDRALSRKSTQVLVRAVLLDFTWSQPPSRSNHVNQVPRINDYLDRTHFKTPISFPRLRSTPGILVSLILPLRSYRNHHFLVTVI